MSEERISPGSRYAAVEQSTFVNEKGIETPFLKRRIIPRDTGTEIGLHVVTEGERPDTVAAKNLGDPEQFWRLCDSNQKMHPRDLTGEVGAVIRITFLGGSGV